ncbi:MAG: hypothetical protein C0603_00275 [Denitrovibrio sp.]|nr:MAG: hypothetical protein C0603_00275 [Denitrovibrio sp.]
MFKIAILYASRYGATKQVSEMIASHLEFDVDLFNVKKIATLPEGYDVILLGSGIYANKFLPLMDDFINNNRSELIAVKVCLFGVAMRIAMMLDRYDYLEPIHKEMLHGRMDFSILNEKDRAGLERFYTARNFSEEKKMERRMLRDMISDAECKSFAENVVNAIVD